jgi:glycosyltransferase involved in cell wall biosynthesis
MPELSVAIPTFGKPQFLSCAIRSVLCQSMPATAVVADGGSEFDYSVVRSDQLKVLRLVPDPGIARCWGAAASEANTEFVAFLADDNQVDPFFCEKLLQLLRDCPGCDIAFCNQAWIDEQGNTLPEIPGTLTAEQFGRSQFSIGELSQSDLRRAVEYNSFPLEACIVRASRLRRCEFGRVEAAGALDLDLFLQLVNSGARFAFLPESLMSFRVHESSYSASRRTEHLRGLIWVLQNNPSRDSAISSLMQDKLVSARGRLLREVVDPLETCRLILAMVSHKRGFYEVIKNLVARLAGKNI